MESQTTLVSSSPTTGCLPASLALFKQDESSLCLDSRASDLSPVPENRLARQPGLKVSCFLALGLSDSETGDHRNFIISGVCYGRWDLSMANVDCLGLSLGIINEGITLGIWGNGHIVFLA